MKNLIFIFILATTLFANLTVADYRIGVSIDDDFGLRIKKNIGKHQLGVGANYSQTHYKSGFSSLDSDFGSNLGYETKSRNYTANIFYRYNKPSSEKLVRFIEAEFRYGLTKIKQSSFATIDPEKYNLKNKGIAVHYGIEYFLIPEFSIEGKFGAEYSQTKGYTRDDDFFRAFSSSIALSYYW